MKISKPIKIVFIFLTISAIAVGVFLYLRDYSEQRKIKIDQDKVLTTLKRGIDLYNDNQIALSVDTLYKAWNEAVEIDVPNAKEEIAYWIAKVDYEHFGYDEIEEIISFIDETRAASFFGKKSRILLASIYEDQQLYNDAEKVYVNCLDKAKAVNDTLYVYEVIAKMMALYEKKGDWISPQFVGLTNINYFNNESVLSRDTGLMALLASEVFRYIISEGDVSFGKINSSETQEVIDEYLKIEKTVDELINGRIYRNAGLIYKNIAWDTASNRYNDTILLQSLGLYKKASKIFYNKDTTGYDYYISMIGLADTYGKLDSIEQSNRVLGMLDTNGISVLLKLKIANEKGTNAISQRKYALATKILNDAESFSTDYTEISDHKQHRVIGEIILTKQLLREALGLANSPDLNNSLIDLQNDLLEERRQTSFKIVADYFPKMVKYFNEMQSKYNQTIPSKPSEDFEDEFIIIILIISLVIILYFYLLSVWSKIPTKVLSLSYPINDDFFVKHGEIMYIKKDGNKVWYHLKNGTKHDEYISIEKLMKGNSEIEKLPDNIFVKCQQSYIVNAFEVIGFEKGDVGIMMSNGDIVKVSPKGKDAIFENIQKLKTQTDYEHFVDIINYDIQITIEAAKVKSEMIKERWRNKFATLKK